MDIEKIYKRWSYEDMGERFSKRSSWAQLFSSEKRIFSKLKGNLNSVLDVGCAVGGMSKVFDLMWPGINYTGLDVSVAMINQAKTYFPQHTFIVANILSFRAATKHDLVFATGVFQHEPQYAEAIVKLVELADKYVTFDCKIISANASIVDIGISYCDHNDRLFYILLSFKDLLDILKKIENIKSVYLYGYYSHVSERVVVPESIDREKVSVCQVLIEKGSSEKINWEIDLPDEFTEATNETLNIS